jgi:hypothetical protein
LKLLQYIRDEAHRFAQHYHHILRRKTQLEEDVRQGRRPPRKRRNAKPQAAGPVSNASPHTTLPSLPILNPSASDPLPPDPLATLDSEDVAAEVPNPSGPPPMDRDEAIEQHIQPTHVLPPEGTS